MDKVTYINALVKHLRLRGYGFAANINSSMMLKYVDSFRAGWLQAEAEDNIEQGLKDIKTGNLKPLVDVFKGRHI